RALENIGQSQGAELEKVVLARRLVLEADAPINPMAIAARLGGDQSVTAFAMPLPAGPDGAARHLVGATPELLLAKSGRTIRSNPLAGSARRHANAMLDRAAADELARSDK